MSFNLSWNWSNDLLREVLRQKHPDLENFAEEIVPFAQDMLVESMTIVDEEDLIQWGQYSEVSIIDRYRRTQSHAKSAQPQIPGRTKQPESVKE